MGRWREEEEEEAGGDVVRDLGWGVGVGVGEEGERRDI